MKNKKLENQKLTQSEAIQIALEKVMKRHDKQREPLAPKGAEDVEHFSAAREGKGNLSAHPNSMLMLETALRGR